MLGSFVLKLKDYEWDMHQQAYDSVTHLTTSTTTQALQMYLSTFLSNTHTRTVWALPTFNIHINGGLLSWGLLQANVFALMIWPRFRHEDSGQVVFPPLLPQCPVRTFLPQPVHLCVTTAMKHKGAIQLHHVLGSVWCDYGPGPAWFQNKWMVNGKKLIKNIVL